MTGVALMTFKVTPELTARYFDVSVGVKVTESKWAPTPRMAPDAGVYTNVPGVAPTPVVRAEALSWGKITGVPNGISAGVLQVIVGLALTFNVNDWDVFPTEFEALTVRLYEPTAVGGGVPETWPALAVNHGAEGVAAPTVSVGSGYP